MRPWPERLVCDGGVRRLTRHSGAARVLSILRRGRGAVLALFGLIDDMGIEFTHLWISL